MADARPSHFDHVSSYGDPTFSVEKYRSKKTGMKFYHINVPLPLIKLEICVQTKPYDDTGCPHTLGTSSSSNRSGCIPTLLLV